MAFLFETLLPVVAFLTGLLIMGTYMVAKILRIPAWEAYFSIEMHNLVLAMIILGAAFTFFEASKSISYSLLGADPIESSKSFINEIINKGVLPMYKDLLSIEAGSALTNAFALRVGPGVWSFTTKVMPGADAILSIARTLSFGLLSIYGSLSIQYIGLSFIDFAMPIVLSLGVLLFIFPPTREAGAFLISFAIAFQSIFPFLFALNQVILNDMWNARYGHDYDAYTPEMSLFGIQVRGASSLSYAVPIAPFALNFVMLVPFINAMAHLALISLFLPAFATTLTIAFINVLTKYLGGKI